MTASTGRLAGKVAVVTGGASGIGRAIAERIVHEGGKVVVADLRADGHDELATALGDAGVIVACDVTDEGDAARLIEFAQGRYGALDIVVTSAGGGIASPIADHSLDDWRAIVDLNLTGTFLIVRAAAPAMADGGSIIAIASLNAVQPTRGMAAYCAAKAGVVALVDVAALELGPRGIRVNAIAPGLVRTPATEALWQLPEMVDGFVSNTALGRHGSTDDIASAVVFLASDESSYVTGTTMLVDGGAHHLSYPDTGAIRARSAP